MAWLLLAATRDGKGLRPPVGLRHHIDHIRAIVVEIDVALFLAAVIEHPGGQGHAIFRNRPEELPENRLLLRRRSELAPRRTRRRQRLARPGRIFCRQSDGLVDVVGAAGVDAFRVGIDVDADDVEGVGIVAEQDFAELRSLLWVQLCSCTLC